MDSFAQKYSVNSSYMLDPENMNIAQIPKDSDSEADLNLRVTWGAPGWLSHLSI